MQLLLCYKKPCCLELHAVSVCDLTAHFARFRPHDVLLNWLTTAPSAYDS